FDILFLFTHTVTTQIYTLSLHDALPIFTEIKNSQNQILSELNQIISFYDHMAKLDNEYLMRLQNIRTDVGILGIELREYCFGLRSEEHTSELQSRENLVCRLLLEKKNSH